MLMIDAINAIKRNHLTGDCCKPDANPVYRTRPQWKVYNESKRKEVIDMLSNKRTHADIMAKTGTPNSFIYTCKKSIGIKVKEHPTSIKFRVKKLIVDAPDWTYDAQLLSDATDTAINVIYNAVSGITGIERKLDKHKRNRYRLSE